VANDKVDGKKSKTWKTARQRKRKNTSLAGAFPGVCVTGETDRVECVDKTCLVSRLFEPVLGHDVQQDTQERNVNGIAVPSRVDISLDGCGLRGLAGGHGECDALTAGVTGENEG